MVVSLIFSNVIKVKCFLSFVEEKKNTCQTQSRGGTFLKRWDMRFTYPNRQAVMAGSQQ